MSGYSPSIIREIRQILMQSWDPIGIADVPEVGDEYDSYIPDIARAISQGASASDIARLLLSAEEQMGLEPKQGRALEVAAKLLKIGRPA